MHNAQLADAQDPGVQTCMICACTASSLEAERIIRSVCMMRRAERNGQNHLH
jgi:hypothetical protein